MNWKSAIVVIALTCSPAGLALADELTQIVQQDLTGMGYDTGGVTGTANTKTIIAVSRFQSEHDLEVTGEIAPQLAGVIKAAMSKQNRTASRFGGADGAEVASQINTTTGMFHRSMPPSRTSRAPRRTWESPIAISMPAGIHNRLL